jgi:GDP-L-fucose synthase
MKNDKSLKIYVAGHQGMVGSAIVRQLKQNGFNNLILRKHNELDLTNQNEVSEFFKNEVIDQVYLAAAKVGGIDANSNFPAEFIYENIMIEANVIHNAFKSNVKKLLFLGSSCIYPKYADQPMKEEQLLTGELEPTNEPYAIAKIAGIKICESYNRQYGDTHGIDYRSIMPTNLFGPGDNYHPKMSHVIPGLLYRFHEAKMKKAPSVIVWGSGEPKREFLYVDDMAQACLFLMNIDKKIITQNTNPMLSHINVGSGKDITINKLAETIKEVVGYEGQIKFDNSKFDGTPRKLIDSSKINSLGWFPKIGLIEGLTLTYDNFRRKI